MLVPRSFTFIFWGISLIIGTAAQSTNTRASSASSSTSLQILFTVEPTTSTSTASSVSGSSTGTATGTGTVTRSGNSTIATNVVTNVNVNNGPNAINTETAIPSMFPSNSATHLGGFTPLQIITTTGLATWAALVL
ncbi:hypothetical protein FRC17_004563 [Serendipita sp. 399]|nr:hypothetical protein FRC17_004563 [Serendipita sp. 399]